MGNKVIELYSGFVTKFPIVVLVLGRFGTIAGARTAW